MTEPDALSKHWNSKIKLQGRKHTLEVFPLLIPALNQMKKLPFHFLNRLPLHAPARNVVI